MLVCGGRGRPQDAWTVAPGAIPGCEPPRAYRDLGRWLARVLGAQPGEIRRIEDTGRQIGRELGPERADADPDPMQAALAALGFGPVIAKQETSSRSSCAIPPCRDAVRENQTAVCALHTKGDHARSARRPRAACHARRFRAQRSRRSRLHDRATRVRTGSQRMSTRRVAPARPPVGCWVSTPWPSLAPVPSTGMRGRRD
jgi:hypothetical protein